MIIIHNYGLFRYHKESKVNPGGSGLSMSMFVWSKLLVHCWLHSTTIRTNWTHSCRMSYFVLYTALVIYQNSTSNRLHKMSVFGPFPMMSIILSLLLQNRWTDQHPIWHLSTDVFKHTLFSKNMAATSQ